MRKQRIIASLVFMTAIFTNAVSAQIGRSMGIRVGGPTQSYYVGVKSFGPVTAIVGLDYFGVGGEIDSDYRYEETWDGETDVETDHYTASGSLRLFMPRAGVKYSLKPRKDLRSYLLAEGFIVIPTVDFESTVDGTTRKLSDEDRRRIKDALDFLGLTMGFGAEYSFSEAFSIGGEFGLNWLLWNWSDTNSDSYESPHYSWNEEYKYKVKAGLSGSFARMTLNFYF